MRDAALPDRDPTQLKSPFDWVVFDASGTLFQPVPGVGEVYARIGQRYGSRLTEEEVKRDFPHAFARAFGIDGQPQEGPPTNEAVELERWRVIVKNSLYDLDETALDSAFTELWDHFADPRHWRVYEDVQSAFTLAKQSGLKIAIASNFDRRLKRLVQSFLECGSHYLAHVDQLMISADIGWSKPDPRFYDVIAERLACHDRRRLLMIGDDLLNDVTASRAAGWQSRLVDRRLGETLESVLRESLQPSCVT